MCGSIIIKIEDFPIISTEKVIFLNIRWNIKNHEHCAVCNFWSSMAIHMIDTSLESSECKFFEKFFWVPFGVPRLTIKSNLYASLMYFYSKIEMNYVNLIIVPFWYSKNLCCQFWNQGLQILCLTYNNEIFARFH